MKFRRHLRRVGTLLVTTAVACVAMMGGTLASTAFAAENDIASGTCPAYSSTTSDKTCKWVIDQSGTLTIEPTNENEGVICSDEKPWNNYVPYIKSIRFRGKIIAAKGYEYGFQLFSGCKQVKKIDLSNLSVSGLSDLDSMFSGCSKLTSIKGLDTLDTSLVTSFNSMFSGCSNLENIDLSKLNMNNAKYITQMFLNCSALTSITLPETNSGNLKSMFESFYGCSNIKQIDFSEFSTTNVTDVYGLFNQCSSLEKITGLKCGALTDVSNMYKGCRSLTKFDDTCFSSLDTSKIQDFEGVFDGCSSLKSIDITDKVTLYATDLSNLFCGCASLEKIIGLSTINMSNVTTLNGLFSGCKSLASIDLSNFDIDITEDNAKQLFYCCTNLTTIFDDGGFVISPPSTSFGFSHIFDGCDKLVGGKGTSFGGWYLQTDEYGNEDLTHPSTSREMARVDGGPNSGTPGYFTRKGETPHVHNLVDWSTKSSCTQSGYKGGKQCSECVTIVDRGTYVSGYGHTRPDTYTIENEVKATDDTNGSYDKVWRCTVCNEIINSQHVVIKSKSFLYPTHTLDGTTIPANMLFKELDKKKLTDTWTKEEALFYISQGMCLIEETIDWRTKSWDMSYVSEESAKKITSLAFGLFGGKAAYLLANDNEFASCSPKEFSGDNDDYSPNHPTHIASHDYFDSNSYDDCAFWLLNRYCKVINLSNDSAYAALANNTYIGSVDDSLLGNLLLKALPNGATAAQLDKIGAATLCNAVANATSYKELRTNSALYKAIGDYIIANASGADQIAVANKIMLERNAGSGGSSSGSSSSGGSSSGSSISGGGSGGGATSSEVNALKSEIASLKAELEKLKKASGDTETIATLQKTIASLEKNLDAVSASLAQTQNALTLSEMPHKISKNIKRAVGSKVKIALPASASGAKVAFNPASSKYFKVTKSGGVTVLKALKRGKTYTIRVTVTCGDQTKEIVLKLKAK